MSEIKFVYRKCQHVLFLDVSPDSDIKRILLSLRRVSMEECPNCGEEPYQNWALESVSIKAE